LKRQIISVLNRLHLTRPVEWATRPVRYPFQRRERRAFYAQFVTAGDLCFDIGANFGNRTEAFRALGARVVAVEPQGVCLKRLRRQFGRDPEVVIVPEAVAAQVGTAELAIPTETTETATLSERWRTESRWNFMHFTRTETVPTTTLDALIEKHGEPAFAKIDVEGFEDQVLAGLSRAIPALSFEFSGEMPDLVERCLERLEGLGAYRYNVSLPKPLKLLWGDWVDAGELRRRFGEIVKAEPGVAGDVYARRV
jgi:FkbM family methyltransferase